MYLTFDEWKEKGFGVLKGEKSHKRNSNDIAVFSDKQVKRLPEDFEFKKRLLKELKAIEKDYKE
jgi:hypothetical protein